MLHLPAIVCCPSRVLLYTLSLSRLLPLSFRSSSYKTTSALRMGEEELQLKAKRSATFRLCNVSSSTTELLEFRAENPSFHVVLIPGNPGVVSFYKEFVERVYEMLDGRASVTAIGHIGHTRKAIQSQKLISVLYSISGVPLNSVVLVAYRKKKLKDWECRRLFSLQDQIDHKVDFIKQEIQNTELPLLLVGHSIGAYISLEVLRRTSKQVKYCIGLYPFLSLNKDSLWQHLIGGIAASRVLSTALSSAVAMLGSFPSCASRFLVRRVLGKSCSVTAVESVCSHLLQYHTMRNVLFMAMKEFEMLAEVPDWVFIRGKQDQVAFLFGCDDHWGPISMSEEISKQVPEVPLTIEREGHTHGFCCSEAGSIWVADHVVSLINNHFDPSQ